MKKIVLIIALIVLLAPTAHAMEFTAPPVPESAEDLMPQETETFSEGLWKILKEGLKTLQPVLAESARICISLIAITILTSFVTIFPGADSSVTEFVGVLGISAALLKPSAAMIHMGVRTVRELSDYGKLLLPVMTAALAAQGGTVSSAALYSGTAIFDAILCTLITDIVVPMLYLFLCIAVVCSAIGAPVLGQIKDSIKWAMTWGLKIVLYVFTGYLGITGVVNGSADALSVKAARIAISGAVPVVGSLISDASETILVSAGIMKNAAGVYGMLALIAVWIGPFIEIGAQYLLLKVTAAVCSFFGTKSQVKLIQDFSGAMGMLLAMTGTVCLLLLISIICYMKGVSA